MRTINAPTISCAAADTLFPHDEDLKALAPDQLAHKCLEELIGRVDPSVVEWTVVDMDSPYNYKDDTRQELECARAVVGDTTVIFWTQS